MKKNRLFTGWKDVFSFTAAQNMKSGGYKITTFLLGFVIAIIFSLISILMAVFQTGEGEGDDVIEVIEGLGEEISEVYLIDNEVLKDEKLKSLITLSLSLEGMVDEKINVTIIDEKDKNSYVNENENALTVQVTKQEEKVIAFSAYASENSPLNDGTADDYMEYVLSYIDAYGYQIAGVELEDLPYFMAPYHTQSSSVDDSVESVGVMLTEMLVPMLFSLLIYALVLMHGQSVTKAVVAEKSSKLMEMILTSVKPYALIAGKVLAVAAMAIFQLLFWILCGYGGYVIGGIVAENINSDYINYVDAIIEVISADGGAAAFSIGAVILAIIFIIIGFLMYCVLAGLVSASVSKMEDISTAMSMFQIPVIAGWLVAYFSSMFESEAIIKLVHMLPITSPFILPADVVLGKCGMVEAIISLVILSITTVVLILITGKVYKGKIFNRS